MTALKIIGGIILFIGWCYFLSKALGGKNLDDSR